jgi:hypothetical protein
MKIKLLSLFLLVAISTKAQDSLQIIELPFNVAKQIQMDLLAKDSVDEMFNYAIGEIGMLEAKVRVKDSVVAIYSRGILDLTTQLNNEKALKITYKGIAEDCKTDYNKLSKKFSFYKKKATFGGILLGGIALGLASVILIKL